MGVLTSWLKKPHFTKGFDPIGAQAPSINLYSQLLPGITNATERARYYSFYPWVLWRFDHRASMDRSRQAFVDWVRRADVLFTLVAVRHRLRDGDSSQEHDGGLVGSRKLRPAIYELTDGGTLNLSSYSSRDAVPTRYFQNEMGGLGQYYLGPLDELGILSSAEPQARYTSLRGTPLAERFDSLVPGDLFCDTLAEGIVSLDRLDELSPFCPCRLVVPTPEREALSRLFFDLESEYGDAGRQRRHSLGLILDLARALPGHTTLAAQSLDQDLFRACCYSGVLPDGSPWNLSAALGRAREGWAAYQRSEMLSVATQCLFWLGLRFVDATRARFHSLDELCSRYAASPWISEAAAELGGGDYASALSRTRSSLPPLDAWSSDGHEISLTQAALRAYREQTGTQPSPDLLVLAARLLLSLAARDLDPAKSAYAPLALPRNYFSLYPVNLEALRQNSAGIWRNEALGDWLTWLTGHWGFAAHFTVALRKLRHQSQDTFHLVPTDHGLVVEELNDPTYTNPRFTQAFQILQDIGALRRARGQGVEISPHGELLWSRACD